MSDHAPDAPSSRPELVKEALGRAAAESDPLFSERTEGLHSAAVLRRRTVTPPRSRSTRRPVHGVCLRTRFHWSRGSAVVGPRRSDDDGRGHHEGNSQVGRHRTGAQGERE